MAAMFGVIVFPGSNCDQDCAWAIEATLRQRVRVIWHEERDLHGVAVVILPGGFSYGDYLRCGAIARVSPVMGAVEEFAQRGGIVLGICNGFQILIEAGLLPGSLLRNRGLRFVCQDVHIRTENATLPFTRRLATGQVLRMPIAHAEGRYWAPPEAVGRLTRQGQVVFRYCTPDGMDHEGANPNGSIEHIAGVANEAGNVLGLMPHPERCCETLLGNEDGLAIFQSLVETVTVGAAGA